MGKLKALLKKKARAAVYGTIHVKKTRLQMSRMPLEVSDELMQAHHGETLSLFKFRDTETLSERSMWLPASVTLAELRAQAVKIFSYDRRRVEDVMLSYPEEGIATFDNDGESPLRVLATDHDWTEVGLPMPLVSRPRSHRLTSLLCPPPLVVTTRRRSSTGTPERGNGGRRILRGSLTRRRVTSASHRSRWTCWLVRDCCSTPRACPPT